jgi:hypothetical protein
MTARAQNTEGKVFIAVLLRRTGSIHGEPIDSPPRNCQSSTKTPPILHPKTTNPPPRETPEIQEEEAEASDSALPQRNAEKIAKN